MIATWRKADIEAFLSDSFRNRYKRKDVNITGVLLARPGPEADETVIPNLDHWHYRSDYYTEFFCIGYAPHRADETFGAEPVTTVGGHAWYFSAKYFNELLEQIEAETGWRYLSGCYLIVANSRYSEAAGARIDFGNAVLINLGRAVASGAVQSADELAERTFEFAKRINERDSKSNPVWEFSDEVGTRILKRGLRESFLAFLPKSVRNIFTRGEEFVVRTLPAKR
jgi:hypothetical protein